MDMDAELVRVARGVVYISLAMHWNQIWPLLVLYFFKPTVKCIWKALLCIWARVYRIADSVAYFLNNVVDARYLVLAVIVFIEVTWISPLGSTYAPDDLRLDDTVKYALVAA